MASDDGYIVVPQLDGAKYLHGRDFSRDNNTMWFPGHVYDYIMLEHGDALARRLKELPYGRPSDIKRDGCYPCTVKNPQNDLEVKIQPLIGTADDGIYLTLSDIKKLGLQSKGQKIETRRGSCEIYSGVSFCFETDYRGGVISYNIPLVFALPPSTTYAEAGTNCSKEGVIGVRRIDRHAVFGHYNDVHVIDITVLEHLPERATYLHPYDSVRQIIEVQPSTGRHRWRCSPKGPNVPKISIAHSIVVSSGYRIPEFTLASFKANAMPVNTSRPVPECRTCGILEDVEKGVKISLCSQCKKEGREIRALYCSPVCQKKDWKMRHKEEHNGVRHWNLGRPSEGIFMVESQ